MSDQAIEQEIQAKGKIAARVTPADVEAEIVSTHYFSAADGIQGRRDIPMPAMSIENAESLPRVTFCMLILRNGTKVVGINYGAIDPARHSADHGRADARSQAVDKVYELLGFRLRDALANPHKVDAEAHASEVLYPAIKEAMGLLPERESTAVDQAYDALHDAFWSEVPAPADAPKKRATPQ